MRERFREVLDCSGDPGRTKQAFGSEVNINTIVRKYEQTGMVTHLARGVPRYGDFSAATDLKTALDLAHEAHDQFRKMNPYVRKAADNDPVRFLEMLATEEGTQELLDAGLDGDFVRDGDGEQTEPVVAEEAPEAPSEG